MTDYRKLTPSNIRSDEFKHIFLLIFWPVFGIVFRLLEMWESRDYHLVWCFLDDVIPFCELFLIPYFFWFVYMVGMYVYTFFFEVEGFKKMMWFIIITYTVTVIIYLIYPTYQDLRPPVFERDNILTRIMASFYEFDTNTNVCPSMHVIGALAVQFGAWNSKRFSTVGWKIAFTVTTTLICASTVFLKQHSALDIPPALFISFITYFLVYKTRIFEKTVDKEIKGEYNELTDESSHF